MYTGIKFANNASTQLFKSITSDSTELEVEDNYAAIFPTLGNTGDYFMLTLQDTTGKREIVKCTGRTDSVLTVVRAQEGTTAKSFPVGALLELRLTADSITKVSEEASVVKYHASTVAADVGQATAAEYGHIKLTDNFESGEQAIAGVACSPYGFQQAATRLQGLKEQILITASTTWTVPENGTYKIICIGAGGKGGNGGNGAAGAWTENAPNGEVPSYGTGAYAGGSGGGGGAGQVITSSILLEKNQSVLINIGASPGGSTTFGSLLSALGGGSGTAGSSATAPHDYSSGSSGYGGTAGFSYGSAATNGSSGSSQEVGGGSGGADRVSISGTAGGIAGVSTNGTYGNGGRGGTGGGAYFPPEVGYGGTVGAAGTQGCVIIQNVIGS